MPKLSELPDALTVTDDDYFTIVDNPSGTPVTKRISALNAKTYFSDGGGSGLPHGYIDASDFVDPGKAAFWTSGPVPLAGDSTADFQALFDYVATLSSVSGGSARVNRGNVTILIPRGLYVLGGTVTIPSMLSAEFRMTIDATNAQFYHRPPVDGGCSMFKTALPTNSSDAEVQNDVRNFWTWRGGTFGGRNYVGETCFELNAVSRLVMERVYIYGFETGIRGRFVLHCMIRDSEFNANTKYQVHVEASGGADAWTGATPANAASNGMVIQNVRFYGASSQIAQVRIAHSGHTIRDCTFEGAGPANTGGGGGYNIMYDNANTSALTSVAENLWIENSPAVAHFYVNTMHQYLIDIQYSNSSSAVADFWATSLTTIKRVPWPPHNDAGYSNLYKVSGGGVKLRFEGSGAAGQMNAALSNIWVGGKYPTALYVDGGDGIVQKLVYNRRLVEMTYPNTNVLNVNDTEPVLWKVVAQGLPTAP